MNTAPFAASRPVQTTFGVREDVPPTQTQARRSGWAFWPPLIGTGLFAAATIHAQDNAGGLEEVVVTAQKREQKSQDVGITMTALSGTQLKDVGVESALDVAKLSPAVNVSGSFGGQNMMFAIRGVVQQDFNQQSEGPVGVYMDEGYIASNNVAGVGLFDIDHVEILKGPQGTLFGRNATGGIVSFTTRKPTDQFTADAEADYGSYNEKRFEGAVGGPLTDQIQARLAVLYDQNGSYITNLAPTGGDLGGKKTQAVRARIAFEPTDDVSVLLTAYDSNTEQSWGPYLFIHTQDTAVNGVPNSVQVPGNAPFFGAGGPAGFAPPTYQTLDANSAQSTGGFNRVSGGDLKVDWHVGRSDFTAITAYTEVKTHLLLDDDASPITFLNTDNFATVRNWSEELRYFLSGDRYRWTSGLYYLHIDSSVLDNQDLADLGGVETSSPFGLKTDSYSGFSQVEYDIAPQFTLVGGARYTREDKDFHYAANIYTPGLGMLLVPDARVFPDPDDPTHTPGDLRENLYSGKLQLEYRPQTDVMFYGGISRGTKAGSFNAPFAGGATPADPQVPYKPEVLVSYEVGGKTTLLDHTLQLNGAVFYYDYHDYQGFKFVNLATVVSNYPATVKGGEFDVEYRPVTALTLSLGAAYTDSVVKNVVTSNSLVAAYTFASRRAPYTSPWTATGLIRYEWPVAAGRFSLQADARYTGDFFQNLTNFDSTRVAGYTLLGARAAWVDPSGRWELAVNGKNLTNKFVRTVGFDASGFGGFTQTGYIEPRWFEGSVAYHF
jgi:iron complex outermembrane receptor protein